MAKSPLPIVKSFTTLGFGAPGPMVFTTFLTTLLLTLAAGCVRVCVCVCARVTCHVHHIHESATFYMYRDRQTHMISHDHGRPDVSGQGNDAQLLAGWLEV